MLLVKRRNLLSLADLLAADYGALNDFTTRGFTGHEMLDEVGVIHMNGRVYDPGLGRFMSADPIISDLSNVQRLNRYSYVLNSPLSYTDPSGFDNDCRWCGGFYPGPWVEIGSPDLILIITRNPGSSANTVDPSNEIYGPSGGTGGLSIGADVEATIAATVAVENAAAASSASTVDAGNDPAADTAAAEAAAAAERALLLAAVAERLVGVSDSVNPSSGDNSINSTTGTGSPVLQTDIVDVGTPVLDRAQKNSGNTSALDIHGSIQIPFFGGLEVGFVTFRYPPDIGLFTTISKDVGGITTGRLAAGVGYTPGARSTFDGIGAELTSGIGAYGGSIGVALDGGSTPNSLSLDVGPQLGVSAIATQTFSFTIRDVGRGLARIINGDGGPIIGEGR